MSNLLTPKAAMAQLCVGRTLFYRLVKEGKIEVIRFGKRCTRIRQSELDRLVTNGIA
jgi:excisionase family DNA binding protein